MAEKQARKGRPRGADRIVRKDGYIMIRDPHDPKHWQYEHRAVAERVLGRRLQTGEKIRHITDDHADNRVENLVLVVETATPLSELDTANG